ncbi:hypothetical protein SAMN05421690_1002137 [Nitrosomonas sp. Nm51]|uniref:hypothetical protein n=1 Tax=Nitrosomonas sp. Nm51 TaxID=133720 RepID=UPI0008C6C1FC|nr:hypothetical protein [Nitrosomonas sp. Nm51]SEQ85997.1 hypothetical protein SAMN05421690_1002137 [Nitrosomonas sp. Nm51]
MSMKKWTDEELISTRDKLEEWRERYQKAGNKMWHFTAFLGAFAVSTGVVFIFFDGVDVLNVLLIIMGSLTCLAWYKSERRRQDNLNFLNEINRELKQRAKKAAKPKTKQDNIEKSNTQSETDQTVQHETQKADINSSNTDDSSSGADKETKNQT